MPNIRDISLFIGRTSLSEDAVVRIAFNVDFSPQEQKLREGFIMHILLIDVNGGVDDFQAGAHGLCLHEKIDEPDRIIGEVYHDIVHPNGPVMRVDRTKSWDFGDLGKDMEEFRAIIAIIPKNWEYSPGLEISGSVKIDL